jgi:hypothetical protein
MAPETTRARSLAYVPAGVCAAVLAFVTVREVIARSGGPAAPLDDTYIHFQYARSIAELHPFRYTVGAAPTPGATSLLWPLMLAPFYALGFRQERLLWIAWAFAFAALAMLAVETKRVAEGLVETRLAVAAGAMVIAFGGYTWFAGSGMEVLPFAYLLARSAREAVDWLEGGTLGVATVADSATDEARAAPTKQKYRALVFLAFLTPLMRPEGAIASLFIAVALVLRPYRGARKYAALALSGILAPSLVAFLATGQAVASTAVAKWLPLNPYYCGFRLFYAVLYNVGIFFGTLLDGRLWTSVFLPSGGRVVGAASLLAIPLVGFLRERRARSAVVFAVAVAILLPTTYETFLVNRVRYNWPFAWAWFIGLAALADLCGSAVQRGLRRFGLPAVDVPLLVAGTVVGVLASQLRPSIEDLATSAEAVTLQQVSLARWARDGLSPGARVGVNDTGAMAYFSDHPTFDVVGLTTRGEARYWTAGPGSRFEHYEHLSRTVLPDYFSVYPEWFGVDALLGEELQARSVSHTILGGYTMAAYQANYALLGSGALPTEAHAPSPSPLDTLDVADIDDEAAHAYALLDATRETDVVIASTDRADGARRERRRDEFSLRLAPGGRLVARWGSDAPLRLRVSIDGKTVAEPMLATGHWQEFSLEIPRDVPDGSHAVVVDGRGEAFDSLHYWSYR